jgi:hypothetical protein
MVNTLNINYFRDARPQTPDPVFLFKKTKKNVDIPLVICDIGATHGNKQTKQNMRTKILLLAAAALAAGVVSSNAQVYSANVVGYANVVLKGNGQFTLVANPFDDGNGNYATNLLNNALPKKSEFLHWNGGTFDIVTKGGSPASFPAGTTNQFPPGVGFFVENGSVGSGAADVTNTFVGTVIPNVGLSVTNSEPLGFTLQGSPIPYAGNLAIINQGNGDTNMDFGTPLTKKSEILTWNLSGQTYNIATKGGSPALWNGSATVGVGEGFFVHNVNGPVTNVVETLNP